MNTTLSLLARRSVLLATLLLPAVPALAHSGGYYQEFGGQAGITKLIHRFLGNVQNDRRINRYFAHADMAALQAGLVQQVCQIEGGPCHYAGPSMTDAHRGMGIDEDAFNALVDDLVSAMNRDQVPLAAQNHLLAKLAPMEHQIVTR